VLLDAKADASALADISNTSPLHMLLRCERLTQGPFFPAVFFFLFSFRNCLLTFTCMALAPDRAVVQAEGRNRGHAPKRGFHQRPQHLRRDRSPLYAPIAYDLLPQWLEPAMAHAVWCGSRVLEGQRQGGCDSAQERCSRPRSQQVRSCGLNPPPHSIVACGSVLTRAPPPTQAR
jgi:hypothetical protein